MKIISFYGGAPYYHAAAQSLMEDCDRLGLDHLITEVEILPGQDWIDICRRKISFCRDVHRTTAGGVLWVDADTRLLRKPFTPSASTDFAGFLRGFKYLPDFDPVAMARLFSPSILYFGATERAGRFLEEAVAIEAIDERKATDDFFLQEAFLRFGEQLNIELWRPECVRVDGVGRDDAVFGFQSSGNVGHFRESAAQHQPAMFEQVRTIKILRALATEANVRRDRETHVVLNREINRLDPGDQRAAGSVARSLAKAGQLKRALKVLDVAAAGRRENQTAKRASIDLEIQFGDLDRAQRLSQQLSRSLTEEDRAFASARLWKIASERRAKNVDPADRVKLWWMETPYPGNFGDILNPYLVERLSGVPPVRASAKDALLMIGSTIKFARRGSVVWGAGTPRLTDTLDPEATYRAVRGPLTRELVLRSGGECPPVYGDPAWLLPRVFQPTRSAPRKRIGYIQHVVEQPTKIASKDVRVISLKCVGAEGIENVIEQIIACDVIVSTSLHGLIVAHAYGVPATWAEPAGHAGAIPGDGTKFLDYLLTVGLSARAAPLPADDLASLVRAADAALLPAQQISVDNLVSAAPFSIIPLN